VLNLVHEVMVVDNKQDDNSNEDDSNNADGAKKE
jgi:hypothetical protein